MPRLPATLTLLLRFAREILEGSQTSGTDGSIRRAEESLRMAANIKGAIRAVNDQYLFYSSAGRNCGRHLGETAGVPATSGTGWTPFHH